MKFMTNEEKHMQILKEVKATFVLIAIVAAWHIGFAFLLEDIDMLVLGMPLWFFVSTIGAFVISVAGVAVLLKKVFKDFGPVDTSYDIRCACGPVIPNGKAKDMQEETFNWMANKLEEWNMPTER